MLSEQDRAKGVASFLPSEILILILRNALPPILDEGGRIQFQQFRMVCSQWRIVCLSTPVFWSSVAFENSFGDAEILYADSTNLLRKWFTRAGPSIPLTLSFTSPYCDEEHKLISLIHEHQERFQSLFLDIDTQLFWSLLKMCPHDRWTNLCHIGISDALIDIEDPENDMEDLPVESHPLADRFPNVMQFTVYIGLATPQTIYPVAQNTVKRLTLYADDINTAYFSPFLSKYHLLTHLDIHCTQESFFESMGPETASFESLQHLSFTSKPDWENWSFLKRLRTPALSDLILKFIPRLDENRKRRRILQQDASTVEFVHPLSGVGTLPPAIQPLLESCNKNGRLMGFSLKGTIPPHLVQRILALLPDSVTKLDLQYWPYRALGESSLDYKPPEAWEGKFFPNLETLRIAEVPSHAFSLPHAKWSVQALILFASQRMEQTETQLKSLEVARGEGSADCFPEQELEDLRKKGLNAIVWVPMWIS
ncbi:hypothetical protein BKA70DRAFT_1307428 [Coprinopsis sp. MPI-PUGE-AT-0042]|nr:hypothetical protein BKA70DRAFT_1307428 [Coprinopsis sp. MPI-PUGE-AT-0042]